MSSTGLPTNCKECPFSPECLGAHYGSLGCKFRAEILKHLNVEDVVTEPSHYKHGLFETIDEMLIVFGPQRTYDYCIINAWKYRSRAPYKGKQTQDLEKSDQYLKMAKQIMDANPSCFYCTPVTLIKEK